MKKVIKNREFSLKDRSDQNYTNFNSEFTDEDINETYFSVSLA